MRKRSGITVLELLIVTIVIALLATLAYIRYDDVREEAYVVAMMNDLRNYAIAQYEYRSNHGSWGTEEIIQAKTWFDYSKDVFPDTATAYSTADAFYLRVYHKKTNRYCELEVLSKDGISATHNQIKCPGKDSNESATEPTEPTLAAPTITPPPGFFVSANETYDAVFIVHNNSSLTRTFQLSVQSSNPDVVPTPPNPSAVTIAGRSSRSVTIHFTVSGDAVAGMASTLSLHAVDVEAPQLAGSGATQAIVASELMSPTVTAVSPAVVAAPGGSYSLDFVVVNNSNTTRSFEFMAISSDPSVVPNPANPPGQSIGAHAQVTVTVSITVSASASDADLSNVTLVATDADAPELSGDASTAVQVVVVVENRPPTASLNCPNQVTRSTLYSCTATFSDPDGNLSHTSWGALSVRSKTFTSSAVPKIERQVITVLDLGGLYAMAFADVEVINLPPKVTLSCPDTVYTNEPFICQAWAEDPEGDPVFNSWNSWTRQYSFDAPGLHSVSITVWDSYDGSFTAHAEIWVMDEPNIAPLATVICNPAEAHVGLVSTCELRGSDPDGDWPLTPSWSSCLPFTSTGPSCTSEQTVVLGTLTVSGYVTDSRGLASPIDSAQIVGTNTTPTASVLCDKLEASIGEEITCTLTGHDPDPHPDNDGIQPSWGSSLKTFTFEAPGRQSICGYVTDMHGAVSDEDCWDVNVRERPEEPINSLPRINDLNGVGLRCLSDGIGGYSVSVRFQAEAFDPDQDPLTYSWVVEFEGPVPPGWSSRPTPSGGYGPSSSFETHFSMTIVPESYMPSIMVWVTVHDNKGGSAELIKEFSPLRFCSGLGI